MTASDRDLGDSSISRTSLNEIARALVHCWEHELPTGVPRVPAVIMMTQAVRDRMREDIVRLLNNAISVSTRLR